MAFPVPAPEVPDPFPSRPVSVAIACGGTGGHLFPGLAVARELISLGASPFLMVSQKEIDALALKGCDDVESVRLPAVGMGQKGLRAVISGLWNSVRICRDEFASRQTAAVVSMGGFTSVAPLWVGRRTGCRLYLHDSNAVPGKANRWFARWVTRVFVAFPEAGSRLRARSVEVVGTPVRVELSQPGSQAVARRALGLEPDRPVVLVMGGSQGARGVNDSFLKCLPGLVEGVPGIQVLHLCGEPDLEKVRQAYRGFPSTAVVHPFLSSMDLALTAATVSVSRAGGSSLAELASMQVPAVLIPYPAAADDHQAANAAAFCRAGAGFWISQPEALDGKLLQPLLRLIVESGTREAMIDALRRWHSPEAARRIALGVLGRDGVEGGRLRPGVPVVSGLGL